MNKRLLLKVFVLSVLFCQLVSKASAQYAVAGTAPVDMQRSVYWLTWNPTGNTFGLIPPIGAASNKIITDQDYIWNYSTTTRIKAKITNLVITESSVGTPFLNRILQVHGMVTALMYFIMGMKKRQKLQITRITLQVLHQGALLVHLIREVFQAPP
jgi:hypothetical protein